MPRPGQSAAEYFPPPESEGGWRTIVPPNADATAAQKRDVLEKSGLNWETLKHAWDYDLTTIGPDSHKSLLVIRHGWIAFEQYYSYDGAYDKDTRTAFASGTKTLVGVGFARLFSERRCQDTDYVYRYMPALWSDGEPARKVIQIRHFLTMTSGLEPYDGPYDPRTYAQTINDLAVIARPGTQWFYNTGALDLMNYVIANRTGLSLQDFLNSEIMPSVGAAPVHVQPGSKFDDHAFCSSYRITSRDYARIGYLLLKDGRWASQQIVDRDVVALITSCPSWLPHATLGSSVGTPERPNDNYGYTFWLNRTGAMPGIPTDAFMASGGNHKMIVMPSLDMIVARVGNYVSSTEDEVSQIYQFIRHAIRPDSSTTESNSAAHSSTRRTHRATRHDNPATATEIPSGEHLELTPAAGICAHPMEIAQDPNDPTIRYAWLPGHHAANYDVPGGPASISFLFRVPTSGAYDIWIRAIAPDRDSNSYFLRLDGRVIDEPWFILEVPKSTEWQWSRIRAGKTIDAGAHVLEFRHRESGVKLSAVVITSRREFTPDATPLPGPAR